MSSTTFTSSSSFSSAFATLTPTGVLAKLAFHSAVEQGLSQNNTANYRRFLSVQVQRKYDHETSLFLRRCRLNQDPEDALSDIATECDTDTEQDENRLGMIWTGHYQFLHLADEPAIGWIAGRSMVEFLTPNKLHSNPIQGIRERHAIFNINTTTGHLYVRSRGSDNGPSQVSVDGQTVQRGGSYALNRRKMNIRLGPLEYVFDYTPFAQTTQFNQERQRYVRQFLGVKVDVDFAPTPISANPLKIGSWTTDNSLGKGTFGRVYRATNDKGEVAVIKFIERHPGRAENVEKRIKTLQELTELAKAENEEGRLLLLRDVVRHNEHMSAKWEDVALVLHPVATQTFQTLIEAAKPFEGMNSMPMKLFLDALKCVEFLHSHRWLHGDLKPANIGIIGSRAFLIDNDDSVRLRPGKRISTTPGHCGSIPYLSPEREMQSYGLEADVWSMGIIGFMLICGYHPWELNLNPWRSGEIFEKERPSFELKYEMAMHHLCRNNDMSPFSSLLMEMLRYEWAHVNTGSRISIHEAVEHSCRVGNSDEPRAKKRR